jgi:UDP-glucose 4-epimerase
MSILITGGAGYIGNHVVKLLLENSDYDITVIDNLVIGFKDTIDILEQIRDFQFIEADLNNWNEIKGIFKTKKFDVIIHFAASLVVPESVEKPLKYYLNNTANTANLINLADAHIKAIDYLENNKSDVFNVGYGKGASVKEVIDTVKKVSGVDFKAEFAPRRAGDPALLISDNSKIKEKMGWKPKYDDLEFKGVI